MKVMVWFFSISVLCFVSSNQSSHKPEIVNIGSIFSFSSTKGKVAKIAMKAAVEDVNSDPTVLGGSKLGISMHDANYSGFLSIIGALQYMESDTVAIIGPQTSGMAHVLSHLATQLKTPLLSFTALDPTLSPIQYPFFIQTAPNDLFQMSAVAEIVTYFGWREVIVIYADDDQFRNSISPLVDKLAEKRCRISYKLPLPPDNFVSSDNITDMLLQVTMMEPRILILHTYEKTGLAVFRIAKSLGMMESGYVWIATSWLSSVLDSAPTKYRMVSDSIHGVLTLRPHTPNTEKKRAFMDRWSRISNDSIGLNSYGLYAYDTVWMIARAVRAFWDSGGIISFSGDSDLKSLAGRSSLNLEALAVFDEGGDLVTKILETNMTGLTGPIRFNPDRSLSYPAFDVLNVVGTGYQRIGYWTNYSGISVAAPETLYSKLPNQTSASQQLRSVVWPGGSVEKPRGWVFSNSGKRLRIGVPNRVGFKDFVSKNEGTNGVQGYSIDVFLAAINLLPYGVPYQFILFGDGVENPSYSDLVTKITENVFDAVVGDVTIVTDRTKIVDFTQPYIESGLVVIAQVRKSNSNTWAFLKPFSPSMWAITAAFFVIIGTVVWILEHRTNEEFRGSPKKQIATILWFSCSTLFNSHKETIMSTLGRVVLIIWLFIVLIINSSYTASLTSILTVQRLSSPIKGIETLMSDGGRVGFQVGSFAENYLHEELNIPKARLVALSTSDDYASALENGTVVAVVDEGPYVELFLSNHCKFSIVGRQFTKSGWGFAFPKDSPLALDMTTAIITLSENGELQKIHDKWLTKTACITQTSQIGTDQLQLKSFDGLFIICGVACSLALLIYFCLMIHKFFQDVPEDSTQGESRSISQHLQIFCSLFNERARSQSRA